jgi:hypothetical protein
LGCQCFSGGAVVRATRLSINFTSTTVMRKVINPQYLLDGVDIGAIYLDPKSRDDIPQVLRGLQYIYTHEELRARVFAILREVIPVRAKGDGKADADKGRPGMEQWRILVLGVMRLGLNADYDRIQELANQHGTLRQMLGHGDWDDKTEYKLQTLKDNLRLFTPELLDRINQEVVRAGQVLVKKKAPDEALAARVDSFVVETNVHYPTDINLLWDAIRKTIEIARDLCQEYDLTDWRQSAYQLREFKKLYRAAQKHKRATVKDEAKRAAKLALVRTAHQAYIDRAREHVQRARQTRARLAERVLCEGLLSELDLFIEHAERQIDQIDRRVLQDQRIPHEEKVFSLFQPHTEWIVKGKAGVPVELGLRTCIVEDQFGFILHHQVMEKTTDDAIAVSIVTATRQRFTLGSVSMDKGFHSPANRRELEQLVGLVVMPKKGRLSAVDREREADEEFVRLRQQHSAVESAINALEAHGLDRCPDHGIIGFKRYVALAVVARNVQRLGAVLRQQDAERIRKQYRRAA